MPYIEERAEREDRPTITTTTSANTSVSAPVVVSETPDDIQDRNQRKCQSYSHRYTGEWPAPPLLPQLTLGGRPSVSQQPILPIDSTGHTIPQCCVCRKHIVGDHHHNQHRTDTSDQPLANAYQPSHPPAVVKHRHILCANCILVNGQSSGPTCTVSQSTLTLDALSSGGVGRSIAGGCESDDSGTGSMSTSPSEQMSSSPTSSSSSSASSGSTSLSTTTSAGHSPTASSGDRSDDNDRQSHNEPGVSDEQMREFRQNDRNIGAVRQAMRVEANRLKSYYLAGEQIWTVPGVRPQDLARAGFFMLENDRVQCPFCTGVIRSWAPGLWPLEEHSRNFPLCPFIMEEDVGNVPIGSDPIRDPQPVTGHDVCGGMGSGRTSPEEEALIAAELIGATTPSPTDAQPPESGSGPPLPPRASHPGYRQPIDVQSLGIQLYSGPKNPEMGPLESRRLTFQSHRWDHSIPVSPDSLAEAGFFYIGYRDAVKCFHCGGGLAEWAAGDDPWVEHAKMFPDCSFLKLNKSHSFIRESRGGGGPDNNTTTSLSPEPMATTPPPTVMTTDDESVCRLVDEWMGADVVRELIGYNLYSRDVIKATLNRRYHTCRKPFDSFAQLFDAVSALADSRPDTHTAAVAQIASSVIEPHTRPSNGVAIDDHKPMDINNKCQPKASARRPMGASIAPTVALTMSSNVNTTTNKLVANTSPVASTPILLTSGSMDTNTTTTTVASSSSPISLSDQTSDQSLGSKPMLLLPPSPTSRLACKICLGAEIEVVFLPCGHQMACSECAQRLTDCPVCRQPIRGFVRTFFS